MKKIFLLFAAVLLFYPYQSRAENNQNIIQIFQEESKRFNVPVILLLAIAKTESNYNPWAINIAGKGYHPKTKQEAINILKRNNKKSFDVGIMQINSWWLRKYNIPYELALDPKINIMLGAYIMAHNMEHKGGLNWKSIGAYHSPNLSRQIRYFNKIKQNILYMEKVLIGEK